MRCVWLQIVVLMLIVAMTSSAQTSNFTPKSQQIPVPECLTIKELSEDGSKPCSPTEHDAWLADITHWRMERRIRTGYDGARYELPALQWTQSSFIQPQMMVQDRYFYDPEGRQIHRGSLPRRSRKALRGN